MVVRENPNVPIVATICLHCGEGLDTLLVENGDSDHSDCHDMARQEAEDDREEEARLNPHKMG